MVQLFSRVMSYVLQVWNSSSYLGCKLNVHFSLVFIYLIHGLGSWRVFLRRVSS